MVFLKKHLGPLSGALAVLLVTQGCGPTVTLVSYVDTDTFISSTDSASHAELPYLKVSNSAALEERTLLKLPTGTEDSNYNLDQIFGNLSDPLSWPLFPFVIFLDIFAAFFNCTSQTLAATNLQSSFLVLNVNQNAGGAGALSQITIQHAAKPWWQTVSWSQAFPFSGAGTWAKAGGDLDSTFTPIAGATTDGGTTVQFDVTAYFKTLLANQNLPHYGFIMRAAGGAALAPVTLNSVQFGGFSTQPRLVSTYNCVAPVTSLELQDPPALKPYTYYLGQRR